MGKSLVLKEMAYSQVSSGIPAGFIALEESSKSVLHNMLAMDMGASQQVFDYLTTEEQHAQLSSAEWADRITFYTDRGREYGPAVLNQIRYLAVAKGVKVVFIDHLSAIFATFKDERKEIDEYLYTIRQLAQELGIAIIAATHLTDPKEGKSHNEGGIPRLTQLRGSSSLSRVPDTIIGVRRNCSSEGEREYTELILLKSRFNGLSLGKSFWLRMVQGRLVEVEKPQTEEDNTNYGF